MNNTRKSFVRRALLDRRGQILPWAALGLISLLGMAGLTVDVGHLFVVHNQLQYSTNAAALAGAGTLPAANASSVAQTYGSGATGDENASGLLGTVTTTVTPECLSTLTAQGLVCAAPADANAIQVKQTTSVPTFFMSVMGINSVPIGAKATAAEAGGQNQKWNIAIIEDTTASMSDADSGLQCSGTQISCALAGIRTMLGKLSPCGGTGTCVPSSGDPLMVNGAVDSVALFVFPAVTVSTESKDYVCPTSNPTIVPYTFQNVTAGSPNLTQPSTATYEIVPFSSNYRTSNTSALNPSAQIVIAAGGGSCAGVKSPGGEATYYAQAIYAAQAALVAQQTAYPDTKNAMIILSDGDATACGTNANTSAGACASAGNITATTGHLNGTTAASGCTAANNCSPTGVTYPSLLGECGQAVTAASQAATAGTRVYTIAYGALNSGCLSDAQYSASITTGGGAWGAGDSPCKAIAAMASSVNYFYSDDADGCPATTSTNMNFTTLTGMFTAITNNLSVPRLIPNTTT
jgi:Flp pilus assembly protein TadG